MQYNTDTKAIQGTPRQLKQKQGKTGQRAQPRPPSGLGGFSKKLSSKNLESQASPPWRYAATAVVIQKVKRGKKEKKKKTRKDDGRAWRGLEKVAHNGHGP